MRAPISLTFDSRNLEDCYPIETMRFGASVEHERHLGGRPLRKCKKNNVEKSNIVFIDLESDRVIIDTTKYLPTKNGDGSERLMKGNKVRTRSSWKDVILLDGDEDMDDDFVGTRAKSGRNSKNGVNFGSPSTTKINGCKVVQENESPINLSKGKRTYLGKATRGNHCGLGDCELMEDSLGSVKEQWEKACSKKRCNLQNGQRAQGHSNEDTTDANENSNVVKDCGQFEETPAVSKQADDEAGNAGLMIGDREKLKQTDEYKKASEKEWASRKRALQAEDEAADSIIHENKGNAGLMMGDREKLKQTDEYKEALEEELASRQLVLQAQAEEAQKQRDLQKQMKAEAARKLDMERRQKQRAEEIRETQKKAEEAQRQRHLQKQMKAEAARKLDMERRQKQRVEEEIREAQKKAEEAQKLLLQTRMKAEAARKLEMERRQKERFAEIRETQKKDEKTSNLKEIVRAEIRKDLKMLEITCSDMASLLIRLGIPVGNGLCPPLSSEVRAAYKRALLTFHPDRASRSDVRQQVVAEEKFKLISRMKEKFTPS